MGGACSILILTPSSLSRFRAVVEEALGLVVGGLLGTGADLATGSDKPRSFPRLATPTPHVNWVLYPEHSFPTSRHCEQYGRRRSHLVFLLVQAKQSSDAPLAGALLRRLRCGTVGGSEEAQEEAGGQARGKVILKENLKKELNVEENQAH